MKESAQEWVRAVNPFSREQYVSISSRLLSLLSIKNIQAIQERAETSAAYISQSDLIIDFASCQYWRGDCENYLFKSEELA